MQKKLLKICIVGKTNAGKSTLLNSLVGETVSISNKKINTTEDLIIGLVNLKNNQLIFYDTPGINNLKKNTNFKINFKRNLWQGLNESDLIIYLIDIKNYYKDEIKNHILKLNETKKDIIIIFNKNDLINKKMILPKIKELDYELKVDSYFSISAKKKLGIDNLKTYLIKKTYFSEWIFNNNEITNKDDIFISNECTRSMMLSLLNKEVPYNIEISNKTFKYLRNSQLKIKQEIKISNNRYKKIILGKNGEKIKEIRTKSQKFISKILKTKVHLYINLVFNAD